MKIYLINILLISLYAILFLSKNDVKGKKIFCSLASLNWIILSGLRHISVGADTYNYKFIFERSIYQSWNNILRNFLSDLFFNTSELEPGYTIFEKTIQVFTTNYQVFLIIVAAIFTISLAIWIYKYSSQPYLSFLLYSTLFYSFFAITGIRQTIASSLVIFIGYKYIKERKFWYFFAISIIAFTIHKSSIVFFPFYFIANKSITKKYIITMFSIFSVVWLFGKKLYIPFSLFLGYEGVLDNKHVGGTLVYTIMISLVFLTSILLRRQVIHNNKFSRHYINAIFIATIFTILTWQNQAFMRIQQYYSPFLMLLIPDIVSSFKKNDRFLIYCFITSILILLFIRNNPQYIFFWQ